MYLMMTSAKVLKSAVIVITINTVLDMNALTGMSRLCDMVCLQRKHPQFGFATKMRSRILIQ